MEQNKKERTIRSETTKVFLFIFAILVVVGIFTIGASVIGSNKFSNVREIQLKQFRAAEVMKTRALDVIGIYYLLATNLDQEVLMRELKRYDGLVENFELARNSLIASYRNSSGSETAKVLAKLEETKQIFDELNNSCRHMTFSMMEGNKMAAAEELPDIDAGIRRFKASLDEIEHLVEKQLDNEVDQAQFVFKHVTRLGITIIILAIFITLGLIYYLMKFLSLSLLPISNLMHNMRQAVFSVDKNLKVISPVSAYSSVVFGEDIVGKKLDDIAYSNVDPKSEAYLKHKMAMDVVFGADDLQWILQEDGLIRQVSRKIEKDGSVEEKILKLTYTPLMEKDLVQNIMIVAEDVTEIESLRAETLARQGELEIIKAVTDIESSDFGSFLENARTQIVECRGLIENLDRSAETRELMFRILHTLKGNARMYNLSSISEVVHLTENIVVDINKELEGGEYITPDQIFTLMQELDKVDDILAVHSKLARKFFGLKDLYSDRAEEILKNSVARIEMALEKNISANLNPALIENALKGANYFEHAPLVMVLKKFEKGAIEETSCIDLSEEYLKLLLENAGIRKFEMDYSRWISLFHAIIDLSRYYAATPEGPRFMILAREITGLAEAENIGFVRFKTLAMLEDRSKAQASIGALWAFMAGVCALESASGWEDPYLYSMRQTVLLEEHLKSDVSAGMLSISLLKSLEKKEIKQSEFWELAKTFLGTKSTEESIAAFIGTSFLAISNEDIIKALKNAGYKDFLNVRQKINKHFSLCALFQQNYCSQLQLDIMRLLATFSKEGRSSFENGEQTLEIPLIRFNEIKNLVETLKTASMSDVQPVVASINLALERAFDYSVVSICKKMERMVYDLSKRMGKDIKFTVSGESTFLPRSRAYALRDALVHVVRNCLDHGIEGPEERVAKGKRAKAVLEINIVKKNDLIEIIVRDDGRGIDADKLVNKALSMGKISQEDSARLTHEEKIHLIFLPNLSTKEEVTQISGRGVGMDAVKNTIATMGGSISVQSRSDIGTEFIMQISAS